MRREKRRERGMEAWVSKDDGGELLEREIYHGGGSNEECMRKRWLSRGVERWVGSVHRLEYIIGGKGLKGNVKNLRSNAS